MQRPSEDGAIGGVPIAHHGTPQRRSSHRHSRMKPGGSTLSNDMPESLTAPVSHSADGCQPLENVPHRRSLLASRWPLFIAIAILFGVYHGLNQLIGMRSG
jgi:hypothetical protein